MSFILKDNNQTRGDANTYKLAFWLLAHILFSPSLHSAILAETAPALTPTGLSVPHLTQNCPLLKSTYYETLRLTKRDFAIRKITAPTLVGNKVLQPPNLLLLALHQLHENEEAFGPDPQNFRPARFLENPQLAFSPAYKPFGGGRTYCPGRFLVVPEIFAFITIALHRLGMVLADQVDDEEPKKKGEGGINRYINQPLGKHIEGFAGQRFPRLDETTITLGISRPMVGDEVWVTLKNGEGKGEWKWRWDKFLNKFDNG